MVIEETDGQHYGNFLETLPPGTYTPHKNGPNDKPVPVVIKTDVIAYGSEEASAAVIARALGDAGFGRVRPLAEGLEGWRKANNPPPGPAQTTATSVG